MMLKSFMIVCACLLHEVVRLCGPPMYLYNLIIIICLGHCAFIYEVSITFQAQKRCGVST